MGPLASAPSRLVSHPVTAAFPASRCNRRILSLGDDGLSSRLSTAGRGRTDCGPFARASSYSYLLLRMAGSAPLVSSLRIAAGERPRVPPEGGLPNQAAPRFG